MKITNEQVEALNQLASHVYEVASSKGFHDDDMEDPINSETAFQISSGHLEISHRWEKHRKSNLSHEELNKPIDINSCVSVKKMRSGIPRYTANLHGEVSELHEAFIEGNLENLCDKAEKMRSLGIRPLTCAEEEIADIIIRALDTAKMLNINVGEAVRAKSSYNETRDYRHGGKTA